MILDTVKENAKSGGAQAVPSYGGEVGMRTLVVLAIATSIDALAVGVSFSCADVNRVSILLLDAGAIGAITFLLCFPGVYIGRRFGAAFRGKAGVIGGILLIGMGVKILWSDVSQVKALSQRDLRDKATIRATQQRCSSLP